VLIRAEKPVDREEDVFMVLELEPGYLFGASGTVRYDTAFRDV